jgi:hypothetical protein
MGTSTTVMTLMMVPQAIFANATAVASLDYRVAAN